ncbi:hypothetical protein MAC_04173 [Metarhizium acridum CQMa 102]|uniref:Uncharacterized protein n=1 Tax=Metarhizium acridum (strain CQMa 102) TaxID=655827 RepID=E9E2S5_METAQ|nr:uncharacterized protein MAC_04173 [Metarhizium acridum CQMa 102]EFY89741.1 hypothetical protein MAC_04173 [Metarhizium acridum CQMa 102]
MEKRLLGLRDKTILFDKCIGTYVKFAGTRATPEDVVNHIQITAFRRLFLKSEKERGLQAVHLRPNWDLVSAFFENEQDAKKAWRELYEAKVIDGKTFSGENYDTDSTQAKKLCANLLKAKHVAGYTPPEPTRRMALDEYVDDFIRQCKEKKEPPPVLQAADPSQVEFEVSPNITWGNTRRGLKP